MKRKMAKISLLEMVDLVMAQVGINREQATIAFDAVVHYMRQHPTEPLHKAFDMLFGRNEDKNRSLN
ncbi:MAG TPA: hypothetical protein VLC28_09235 [Flavitalea sp.]|nr:hypothetical protein [Flavitalea sp.]